MPLFCKLLPGGAAIFDKEFPFRCSKLTNRFFFIVMRLPVQNYLPSINYLLVFFNPLGVLDHDRINIHLSVNIKSIHHHHNAISWFESKQSEINVIFIFENLCLFRAISHPSSNFIITNRLYLVAKSISWMLFKQLGFG